MLLRLILLFTVVPLVELWLLMQISRVTGPLFTLTLVILTGVVGATLARRQGWQTWQRIQRELSEGKAPGGSLVDGLLILIAGAVLITPGVLTDIVGFALLIPPVRAALKRGLASRFKAQAAVQFQMGRAPGWHRPDSSSNDTIIDAEVLHRSTDED